MVRCAHFTTNGLRSVGPLCKALYEDMKTLILIDVQKGFDDPFWGIRNNPEAEEVIHNLLSMWRANRGNVVHVQHCSIETDCPLYQYGGGVEFKDFAMPIGSEPVFKKHVNSAFIGTNLQKYLSDTNSKDLVVVGFTTDHCVSTSVRMAGNFGFNVDLVADATATFDRYDHLGNYHSAEAIHNVHLASLHKEFCKVTLASSILRPRV